MSLPNRFNLVDEPWIPVAGRGLVSLATVFSDQSLSALGGNPVQKIALTKLLLAIAQSAYTPKDDDDWKTLGVSGMVKKSLEYLTSKKELFWLYGERPFLQLPVLAELIEQRKNINLRKATKESDIKKVLEAAQPRLLGSGDFPDLPSENNTMLFQRDTKNDMIDAEKALFILSLMSFALAGKQVDNKILLNKDFQDKSAVAKVGPSLGRACYLHTFIFGESINETLFLNLFQMDKILNFIFFEEGRGIPPWENMPISEDCMVARRLKKSYMGTLLPMCRFVLLKDNGLYMTEGIQYPNHKEGWQEFSMAINPSGKDIKVLQSDITKKPWRELVSLLSFVAGQAEFDCQQLRHGINSAKIASIEKINVWSGGIDIEGDAFGQKVKGGDDFVESEIRLDSSVLGKTWFSILKQEMDELEQLSKITWSAIKAFLMGIGVPKKDAGAQASQASNLFWQLSEWKFQELVDACQTVSLDPSSEEIKKLRRIFAGFVDKAYNTYCPKDTARQVDSWAANLPNLSKYLN